MKLKDIKFKCTKTGKNRVAELTLEGYDKKVLVFVSPYSCDRKFGVTLPVYTFGESHDKYSEKELNDMRQICWHVFSTYWVWLKEADVFFNKLVKDGLSVKKTLDVIADNYNRSAEAAAYDFDESFVDVIKEYERDCINGRYPAFQNIELPKNYSYEWQSEEELLKEKNFILF